MSDVNYKISADASAVVQEIGKVRKSLAGLGKLNWANMAMGVQAVMGNLSLIKNAAGSPPPRAAPVAAHSKKITPPARVYKITAYAPRVVCYQCYNAMWAISRASLPARGSKYAMVSMPQRRQTLLSHKLLKI